MKNLQHIRYTASSSATLSRPSIDYGSLLRGPNTAAPLSLVEAFGLRHLSQVTHIGSHNHHGSHSYPVRLMDGSHGGPVGSSIEDNVERTFAGEPLRLLQIRSQTYSGASFSGLSHLLLEVPSSYVPLGGPTRGTTGGIGVSPGFR